MASIISAGTTSGTALNFTGDTSGNLAFQTGGGANTITVPNATGTLISTGTSTRVIPTAAMPVGSVLQTVIANYSTQVTSTTNTYVDMGLSATITPLYSTSKVLVMIDLGGCAKNSGDTWLAIRALRNNATWNDVNNFVGYTGSALPQFFGSCTLTILDAPATTSATTYKIQFQNVLNAGTVYINSGGGSSITLMEIAQ